jgi:hypothetical protein
MATTSVHKSRRRGEKEKLWKTLENFIKKIQDIMYSLGYYLQTELNGWLDCEISTNKLIQ